MKSKKKKTTTAMLYLVEVIDQGLE